MCFVRIRAAVVTTITVVVMLGAWAFAQLVEERPVQPPVTLSGGDIGFRVEAYKGDVVVGTLLVRVGGKWVEAQVGGSGSLRLSTR